MKQSQSSEACTSFADEEIICSLWNLKMQYCVNKSLPLHPSLIQMIHTFPSGAMNEILYAFIFVHVCCIVKLSSLIWSLGFLKRWGIPLPHFDVVCSKHLWSVSEHLQDYMVQHSRKQWSLYSLPREPEIRLLLN